MSFRAKYMAPNEDPSKGETMSQNTQPIEEELAPIFGRLFDMFDECFEIGTRRPK